MKPEIIERRLLNDSRGWFLKAIDGLEPDNPFPCEVYVTAAAPGESRGGHYHPKAKEWFTMLKGEALLFLIDIETGGRSEIRLSADDPKTVFVPAGYAHLFTNTGSEENLLLAYTDLRYDPADTVSYVF